MSIRLIISCDDLGPNRNVLKGIQKSLVSRIVTSASVIVNYGNLRDISAFFHANKTFGMGVHLNFTSGRPILPVGKIPSLVDDQGFFHHRSALLKGARIDPTELEWEFDAQIHQLLKVQVKPTHLDNHHPEIYFFPELFQTTINLAAKYHLPLRVPFTPNFLAGIEKYAKLYGSSKEFLLEKSNEIIERCKLAGLRYPDYFFVDFTAGDKAKTTLLDIINNLGYGISEICVHIGSDEPDLEKELQAVMSPEIMNVIESKHIELVSYSVFNN